MTQTIEFRITDGHRQDHIVRPVQDGDGLGIEALECANALIADDLLGHQKKYVRMHAFTTRFLNELAPHRLQDSWVSLHEETGQVSGLFDFSSDLSTLVHPDFRNRGVKTGALRLILQHMQFFLNTLCIRCSLEDGLHDLRWAKSYEEFKKIASQFWKANPVMFTGFESHVACDNIASLRSNVVLVEEGLLSVKKIEEGVVAFTFPAQENKNENLIASLKRLLT